MNREVSIAVVRGRGFAVMALTARAALMQPMALRAQSAPPGLRQTVVAGLPSGLSANSDAMGVSDIAFVGSLFPTTVSAGPDGAQYVTNNGFGFPPGGGEVVRITIPN